MKLLSQIALTLCAILCNCLVASATPLVYLSTSANLAAVAVGQPFSVDGILSGLVPGRELDSLTSTVTFNGNLLGTPVVSAGPVIPNPLDDPLDFLVNEAAGLADVAFLTFGVDKAEHITTNGVFFSFEVTPLTMGAGTIEFDFVGATLFNAANPNDPTVVAIETGEPLSFVVIPEPSGSTLAAVALLGFLAKSYRGTRRR